MPTRVVFVYAEPYDVYIGRGRCPRTGKRGEWGNPYSHKEGTLAEFRVDSAEDAVAFYRAHVELDPEMVAKVKRELRGKVLGCWCKTSKHPNAPCHGDVLAEIADRED